VTPVTLLGSGLRGSLDPEIGSMATPGDQSPHGVRVQDKDTGAVWIRLARPPRVNPHEDRAAQN